MGLKCGIIGLANSGKTTIFNCLSSSKVHDTSQHGKTNMGQVLVPDQRLHEIDRFIKSAKIVPATVEIMDIPGLTKGSTQEGTINKFLGEIQQADALLHVVRCFDDPNVAHIDGSVNPVRDIETVDLELQIRDLDIIDRRLQRTEKVARVSGDKEAKVIVTVLQKVKEHLETFSNVRDLDLNEEEKKILSESFLLTSKPVLFVCNVDDASAATGNKYVDQVKTALNAQETDVLIIAGKLEAEISELEDAEDRKVFLVDAGLEEPGVNFMVRSAYKMLNLQSFFTAGPKEVRAWTIKKGMTAPQASGVIHSDLERGFIRAEVMKYDDFIKYGTEHAVKEAGKFHVEGKNYIVQEGDILHIRFNV